MLPACVRAAPALPVTRPAPSQAAATRGEAIGSINTAGTANIWIVKPTNNNRGNGIRVFNTFAAIDEHLRKKSLGTQIVVQKYIERPLLYKGRKFGIRQLVLVDNKMNIYVYKVSLQALGAWGGQSRGAVGLIVRYIAVLQSPGRC